MLFGRAANIESYREAGKMEAEDRRLVNTTQEEPRQAAEDESTGRQRRGREFLQRYSVQVLVMRCGWEARRKGLG